MAGGSVGTVCGVDAQAQQIDGEFTRLAGSPIVASWHGVGKAKSTMKAYYSYRAQHAQFVATGAIAVEAGRGRVTRNTRLSPSTAGAVTLGRSCNGLQPELLKPESNFGRQVESKNRVHFSPPETM